MSASALASVNPTHNKTPARTAPMTLTRPLAFRSCCPGQRCPRGAYPWVRAMSWAKPLPSIWTMGRASRSWASLLSRNPCRASWPAFGCVRAFFICHARFAKRLPYGPRCHIKPRSALLSAGVGMVSHLLRKLLRVDLSDLPTLVGPGINPPGPTPDRGNSNREPLRGFSRPRAFLLPYRQNMPTKGCRICHDKQYHINVARLYKQRRVDQRTQSGKNVKPTGRTDLVQKQHGCGRAKRQQDVRHENAGRQWLGRVGPLGVTRKSTNEPVVQSRTAARLPASAQGQRENRKTHLPSSAPWHCRAGTIRPAATRKPSRSAPRTSGGNAAETRGYVILAKGIPSASATIGNAYIAAMKIAKSGYQSCANRNWNFSLGGRAPT